jgi:diaminohydroxyphosphoribosylaminopyrimidine deaminase / 5-amino-6-(5-phosphoribosylamino)uracil reductase
VDETTGYMRRALEIARRADGEVSPRPPVGCVIVAATGEVVAEGWTRAKPGPHAEDDAIARAGERARGGTAYVTLEPCNTKKSKHASCADLLIEAGIKRVVGATVDPCPDVNGQGFAMLREAGLDVTVGICEDEAKELIAPFTKWITTGRPYVTLKLAATLDGKVAAPDGTSRWITGEAARAEVHELRRRADAIMVGSGTVLADDPLLTYRGNTDVRQPVRIVLDSEGRVPRTSKVFNDDAETVVYTREDVPASEGGVDLDAVLADLAERGICHVLVEGGPTLAASLVEQGLVDRLRLYLAPKLIGGDAPGLLSNGVKTIADAWRLSIIDVRRVGDDICIEAERS